jgi:hypothetical protein
VEQLAALGAELAISTLLPFIGGAHAPIGDHGMAAVRELRQLDDGKLLAHLQPRRLGAAPHMLYLSMLPSAPRWMTDLLVTLAVGREGCC